MILMKLTYRRQIMEYNDLYNYVKDISDTLNSGDVKFFHGRLEAITATDFAGEDTVYVFALPFQFSGEFDNIITPKRSVTISMFIFKQDCLGSEVDQNDQSILQAEMAILSDCKRLAEEFITKFNQNTLTAELEASSDKVSIESYTLQPAIKNTSLQLTGYTVDLDITALDTFNYCA